MNKKIIIAGILFAVILIAGCTPKEDEGRVTIDRTTTGTIKTFQDTGDELCTTNGKPIIRLFATSWCPHCQWIKDTYTSTVKSYGDQIDAYLWEVDTNDNLLTPEPDPVPASELAIFKQYNDQQSIPTFVFGCQYLRIGNAYETENNLAAEETEFRAVIDTLLKAHIAENN